MSREDFEKLVAEAILTLPKRIRKKMDNVGIVIEDFPTLEQKSRGGVREGGLLLGLYEGVPRTRRGPGYTMVLPDKITIFQKSLETVAPGAEDLKLQVQRTVWHEVAHHFGFDEHSVQRLARTKKF